MSGGFQAGEGVIWWRQEPGGITVPVRATVLAITPKRIKISVETLEGASGAVVRYVTREHLQPLVVPEDLGCLKENPGALLAAVIHQATPRQLRLFAVACCRREWNCFTEEPSRAAVLTAERFADGLATIDDLDAVRGPAYRARAAGSVAKMAADVAKRDAKQAATLVLGLASGLGTASDRASQLELLWDVFGNTPFRGRPRPGERWYSMHRDSDIFGNDFQPVRFERSWRTATVCGMATTMYESQDFEALPILGDVLEEAGCNLPRVLAHCRGTRKHVRGCWVIDGLLARAEPVGWR